MGALWKDSGSHVVDEANLINPIEQDILRELMGSRCNFAAILAANKKRVFRYLKRGNGQVVSGQKPPASKRECNHKDWEIRRQGFGRSGITKHARIAGFTPGKHWRGTWKTKGLGQGNVDTMHVAAR